MEQTKTFQAVNDAVLIDIINQVQNRLVYIAPGVRSGVAKAIVDAADRLPDGSINVVLDVSAEVCRLGYGDIDGLKMIQASSGSRGYLSSQEGVRIGVVIADDDTLVYSPTPLYLEAEPEVSKAPIQSPFDRSDEHPEERRPVVKPNGILLKKSVPSNLAGACSADGDYVKREIGLDPVRRDVVERTEEDLVKNPPRRFDVARKERVFNSKICFMEFEVTGYRIADKRLELLPEMFVMDEETKKRLASKFLILDKNRLPPVPYTRIVNGQKEPVMLTYDYIEKIRKDVRKDFLINVGKWGNVMLRSRMTEFDTKVNEIEDMLRTFKQGITNACRTLAMESCDKLVEEVSDKLISSPPVIWRNQLAAEQTREGKENTIRALVRQWFEKEITKALATFNPQIKKIEKNVAYDTFYDKKFGAFLEKALGPNWRKNNYDEHDAIPAEAERS